MKMHNAAEAQTIEHRVIKGPIFWHVEMRRIDGTWWRVPCDLDTEDEARMLKAKRDRIWRDRGNDVKP